MQYGLIDGMTWPDNNLTTEMISLFFRNLFFTILQPGIVAVLVPYWILGFRIQGYFDLSFSLAKWLAIAIFIAGVTILLICIAGFAIKGKGTLSPADPTKKLVVSGLYKYSRNPMYAGVIMMLIGEAIFFQSATLWIYAGLIFAAFFLFVRFFEEPRLQKDFGDDYKNYCKSVRRWI